MSEYFPKPKCFGGKVKVELDLSNYSTKADFNVPINVPTNLSNFKSKVDKLVPAPADLSKLSDVVKSDVLKKD